jgi:5-methylcytosine-specific restriction endonuclease McrA
MDVLVLNSAYMPIDRISWKDALANIFTGRAEAVEFYADWTVNSPATQHRVPSIIRFLGKVLGLFRKGPKFNRHNVYLRDKGRCQYCGKKVPRSDFTYDHVHPRAQGGKTTWKNVVISCFPCNQRKRDRTPEQAKMRLLSQPRKPKSLPGTSPIIRWAAGMPESWKDYVVSVSYWTEGLKS